MRAGAVRLALVAMAVVMVSLLPTPAVAAADAGVEDECTPRAIRLQLHADPSQLIILWEATSAKPLASPTVWFGTSEEGPRFFRPPRARSRARGPAAETRLDRMATATAEPLEEEALGHVYRATLERLAAGSTYWYQVGSSCGSRSVVHRFNTPPPDPMSNDAT